MKTLVLIILSFYVFTSSSAQITKSNWGKVDNEACYLYTLKNEIGNEVSVSNYGLAIVSIKIKDKSGIIRDVVLGFDNLEDYIKDQGYYGVIVGRYANRLSDAQFSIDGTTYKLAVNENDNQLHGGLKGFGKTVWNEYELLESEGTRTVVFKRTSPSGEDRYPGSLEMTVSISWNDQNELEIIYEATTDAPTVLNVSHHGYYNLSGHDSGGADEQELKIFAEYFTPIDKELIPTGEILKVTETPFDFTEPKSINKDINSEHPQTLPFNGYDHNWVLSQPYDKNGLHQALTLKSKKSGIVMKIYTNQPGLQMYSCQGCQTVGKDGMTYGNYSGIVIEPQHFPDSPNVLHFPSTTLRPGDKYRHQSLYIFNTD